MHRETLNKLISQLLRQGKTWGVKSKKAAKDSSETEINKKEKRQHQHIRTNRRKRISQNDHDSAQKRLENIKITTKLEELIIIGTLLGIKWVDALKKGSDGNNIFTSKDDSRESNAGKSENGDDNASGTELQKDKDSEESSNERTGIEPTNSDEERQKDKKKEGGESPPEDEGRRRESSTKDQYIIEKDSRTINPDRATTETESISTRDTSPFNIKTEEVNNLLSEKPTAETPSAETPSAETPSAETPSAETPSAETRSISGTFTAGPAIGGGGLRVRAFTANGDLLGESDVSDGGNFTIKVASDYTGAVLIEAYDSDPDTDDYIDERTRTGTSLSSPLRAIATIGDGSLELNVNPITEISTRKLGVEKGATRLAADITTSKIIQTSTQVANALGIPEDFITGDAPDAVINTNGSLISGEKSIYGVILAAISGAEGDSDTDTILEDLASSIDDKGIDEDGALLLVSGAGSVAPELVTSITKATASLSSLTINTVEGTAPNGITAKDDVLLTSGAVNISGRTTADAGVWITIGTERFEANVINDTSGNGATWNLSLDSNFAWPQGSVLIKATAELENSNSDAFRAVVVNTSNELPTGELIIKGLAHQGELLRIQDNLKDTDGLGQRSYQWKSDGETIIGATDKSYKIKETDIGKTLSVTATYTDGRGTTESVTSSSTEQVINLNDQPRGNVWITGTKKEGKVLQAKQNLKDEDGIPSNGIAYQWYADGTALKGETETTLKLGQPHVGKKISVGASYTDNAGNRENKISRSTSKVQNLNNQVTGSITLANATNSSRGITSAIQGDTLKVDTNDLADLDNYQTGNKTGVINSIDRFEHIWRANGKTIKGEKGSTLILSQEHVGKRISVEMRFIDDYGKQERLNSEPTNAIKNTNDTPTGTLLIEGNVTKGEKLKASSEIRDPDGLGPVSYQWKADGTAIKGATGKTFILTQAEVGKTITVDGSYTDGGGQKEIVSSAATAIVTAENSTPQGKLKLSKRKIKQGEEITLIDTLTDSDGIGIKSYQWFADGIEVAGATKRSFTPGQSEVQKRINSLISYIDNSGTQESVWSNKSYRVVDINDTPNGSVVISGTPTQGETLSADSSSITDEDGLGVMAYQWSADGSDISGATGSTYTLKQSDVGKEITATVRYRDQQGTRESLTSAATDKVQNIDDEASGVLTTNGRAEIGNSLESALHSVSDLDGHPTVSFQWQEFLNGIWTDVNGASSSRFSIGDNQAYVGKIFRVLAETTDPLGGGSVFIGEEQKITAPNQIPSTNSKPSGAVTISGTATQGNALKAITNSITDKDGLGSFNYQWQADGSTITGAKNNSYTLSQDDVGKSISVSISYTDGGGTLEVLSSATTKAVANVNDSPSGIVFISGTAKQRYTLNSDTSAITDPDGIGPYSYQWQADGKPISGATASSYTLRPADVDRAISLNVSYTDDEGTTESLTSETTELVKADTSIGSITTVYANQDASIKKNSSQTGNWSNLEAYGGYTPIVALVEFDISKLKGTSISDATFRPYINTLKGNKSSTFSIYSTINNNWDEKTVNWSSRPLRNQHLDTIKVTDTKSYVDFDVTNAIQEAQKGGQSKVTLWIEDSEGEYEQIKFDSLKKTNKPELVVTSGADTTAPTFLSAATSTDGSKVILTYDEALSSTTASASNFKVTVNDVATAISGVATSGSTVELRLGNAVTSNDTVAITYNDPSESNDSNALQDEAGNDVTSINSSSVNNKTNQEILFANYFDIQTNQKEGSEVIGKIHLKRNKDMDNNPIPKTYQYSIKSADTDKFEVETHFDSEGRIFGVLKVRDGKNSGAASLHKLSIELKNGDNVISSEDIVINVKEETLWTSLLEHYTPKTLSNKRLYGKTEFSEKKLEQYIDELESNNGRFAKYDFYGKHPEDIKGKKLEYQWEEVSELIGGLGHAYATSPTYGMNSKNSVNKKRLKNVIYKSLMEYMNNVPIEGKDVVVNGKPIGSELGDGYSRLAENGYVSNNFLTHQWRTSDALGAALIHIWPDLIKDKKNGDKEAVELYETTHQFYQHVFSIVPNNRRMDTLSARWGDIAGENYSEGAWSDANLHHRLRTLQLMPILWADYNKPITYVPYWYDDYFNNTEFEGKTLAKDWSPNGVLADLRHWADRLGTTTQRYNQSGFHPDGTVTHHRGHGASDVAMRAYGYEWLVGNIEAIEYFKDTPLPIDSTRYQFVSDRLDYSYRRAIYKDSLDFLITGRSFDGDMSNFGSKHVAKDISELLENKDSSITITNEASLKELQKSLEEKQHKHTETISFWNGDYLAHRSEDGSSDYYFSVKNKSVRTAGAEDFGSIRKSWHLGSGPFLLRVDGDEYDQDVLLHYDWHTIPGVTEEWRTDALPLGEASASKPGGNTFSGVLADGEYGMSGYHHKPIDTYTAAEAHKTYHLIGKYGTAIGSNISRKSDSTGDNQIITTIDQSEQLGEITYNTNGSTSTITDGDSVNKTVSLSGPSWIHHHNKGYLVLPKTNQNLLIKTGDEIKVTEKGQGKSMNYILALDHGVNPSTLNKDGYTYVMVADVTVDEMPDILSSYINNRETVISGGNYHALQDSKELVSQASFFKPGKVSFEDKSFIESDKPALISMKELENAIRLTVVDPLHDLNSKELTINSSETLKQGVYEYNFGGLSPRTGESISVLRNGETGSTITIQLPDSDDAAYYNYQEAMYAGAPIVITIPKDDITAPTFSSAETSTDGKKVLLTYNEALSSTTAHPSDFNVTVDNTATTISGVTTSGSTVELTLSSAVAYGQTVTVAYTDPTAGNDTNAIQDSAGNDATSLTSTTVSNTISPPDTTAPTFSSAATSTDGTKVIITYNETLSSTTAAASDFTIEVDGSAATISGVATSGSTVELNLSSAVAYGQTVTVAYTDPTAGNDTNAIQDSAGNDAAKLTTESVDNQTVEVSKGTLQILGSTVSDKDWKENVGGGHLRADLSQLNDRDAAKAITYQWFANEDPITGATARDFFLADYNISSESLRVEATYSSSISGATTTSSSPTITSRDWRIFSGGESPSVTGDFPYSGKMERNLVGDNPTPFMATYSKSKSSRTHRGDGWFEDGYRADDNVHYIKSIAASNVGLTAEEGDNVIKIGATSKSKRAELGSRNFNTRVQENQDIYISEKIYLPQEEWDPITQYSTLIFQHKQYPGADPNFELRLSNEGDYKLFARSPYGHYGLKKVDGKYRHNQYPIATLSPDTWHDLKIHLTPSQQSSKGQVSVWLDGEEIFNETGTNLNDKDNTNDSFFKLGMYTNIEDDRHFFVDAVEMSTFLPSTVSDWI